MSSALPAFELTSACRYLRQAEKEAEELLKEQERLMLEAARHEQHSRELEVRCWQLQCRRHMHDRGRGRGR